MKKKVFGGVQDHKQYQVSFRGRHLSALFYCIWKARVDTHSKKLKRDINAVERELLRFKPAAIHWDFPVRRTKSDSQRKELDVLKPKRTARKTSR